VIFCAKDNFWQKLCAILQLEQLATDERFATFGQRYRNRAVLVSTLQEKFLTKTTKDWLKMLRGKVLKTRRQNWCALAARGVSLDSVGRIC
jgi:crotonobetainyl-CoA:carnitine CoA-transferase CaiB-like acyl-CoA transferase